MDFRIRNENNTKPYVVTNVCTTYPRVAMKSDTGVASTPRSYLPLTTSDKQGLAFRARVNNQNYRALEFRSMSGSSTFYTSGANSAGMSSTTALTRASTSRTEYLTRSSTSATSYLTRSSTSGTSYLTASKLPYFAFSYTSVTGNYENSYFGTRVSLFSFGPITSTTSNSFTRRDRDYNHITLTFKTVYCEVRTGSWFVSTGSLAQYEQTTAYRTSYTNSGTTNITVTAFCPMNTAFTGINSQTSEVSYRYSSNNNIEYFTNQNKYLHPYAQDVGSSSYMEGFVDYNTSEVTGTSYLTRSSTYDTIYHTRSSTYSTVYHTRSSTSGYSGVSSSSSETSGWQ